MMVFRLVKSAAERVPPGNIHLPGIFLKGICTQPEEGLDIPDIDVKPG
ncbi:MAG: hypothetical protein MZV70_30885 [Desulfobacterales bacterium]|nr:hypothetical protein [Desulfobacterales bacterium]